MSTGLANDHQGQQRACPICTHRPDVRPQSYPPSQNFKNSLERIVPTLIPLAASLRIAPLPAHAQDTRTTAAVTASNAGCAGAAQLSFVQGRIAEKAAQGLDPLRQFVWRTRMIYQLDLTETVAWLDRRRALLVACEQRSAQVDPGTAARW